MRSGWSWEIRWKIVCIHTCSWSNDVIPRARGTFRARIIVPKISRECGGTIKRVPLSRSLRKQFSIHVPCPVSTSRIVRRVARTCMRVAFVRELNASKTVFPFVFFFFFYEEKFSAHVSRRNWYIEIACNIFLYQIPNQSEAKS